MSIELRDERGGVPKKQNCSSATGFPGKLNSFGYMYTYAFLVICKYRYLKCAFSPLNSFELEDYETSLNGHFDSFPGFLSNILTSV